MRWTKVTILRARDEAEVHSALRARPLLTFAIRFGFTMVVYRLLCLHWCLKRFLECCSRPRPEEKKRPKMSPALLDATAVEVNGRSCGSSKGTTPLASLPSLPPRTWDLVGKLRLARCETSHKKEIILRRSASRGGGRKKNEVEGERSGLGKVWAPEHATTVFRTRQGFGKVSQTNQSSENLCLHFHPKSFRVVERPVCGQT